MSPIILCTFFFFTLASAMPGYPPKYFAVDIDETFYTENEEAMQRNIEAFQRVISAGYQLFFCTGRHPNRATSRIAPDFAERTGYNGGPGVYQNGAVVIDEKCNVISKVSFPKEFIADLLEFIKENKYGKSFRFSGDDYVYIADDIDGCCGVLIDNYASFAAVRRVPHEHIKNMDVTRIRFHNCVKIEKFTKYKDGVDFILKRSSTTTLLTAAGVTKAFGIRKLCEHFGIGPEEIGFIGDGLNDIELMQLSKYSYAVGNAPPEVKQAAKNVVETPYDKGGFAEAMSLVYGV